MENFLAQGVDGIVLAPLDDRALAPGRPRREGTEDPCCHHRLGNRLAGLRQLHRHRQRARRGARGRAAGDLAGRQGRRGGLALAEGSASTTAREKGFLETLAAKYPGMRVVSSNRYGGATTESAYAASENLLSAYGSVQGVFCPNESTTFGMLRALDAAGRSGKVRFVGFDASQKLVEALGQGKIDGLVVQNPFRMGELGVATIVDAIAGRLGRDPRGHRRDDGHARQHDEPPIKILLAPDLAAYLN